MPVQSSSGAVIFSGDDGVGLYRMLTIIQGMKLEMMGMRLTRKAPSCFRIAKEQYGLKGNKAQILAGMIALYEGARNNIKRVEE
jgi:hypothetical protein